MDRVTFHNPDNGWSILKMTPFNNPHGQETVVVHQTKVLWQRNNAIRTDYTRRQALIEIDVLTSMALGVTLEELKTIYRTQFDHPVPSLTPK